MFGIGTFPLRYRTDPFTAGEAARVRKFQVWEPVAVTSAIAAASALVVLVVDVQETSVDSSATKVKSSTAG